MKWQEIKDEYENYMRHFNAIDAEVASEMTCEECGGPMGYIGFKGEGTYVAFSVCQECDEAVEF